MPTDVEVQQTVDTVRQLQSQVNSGGPLSSNNTPPPVSGLKVVQSTELFGSTLVTLTWIEPQDKNISEYKIFVKYNVNDTANPVFLASFAHSPGNVTITADQDISVVLLVQTVYENGAVLEFASCPTVTADVAVSNLPDGSVTDIKISGTLTFGGPAGTKFLSVLDGTNTQVAWGGKSGTDYGIWAKNFWAGGTGPSTAVVTSNGSGVTINGATFTLNLNGATTIIGNTTVYGFTRVALDTQDNSTGIRSVVAPDFISIFNGSGNVCTSVALNGGGTSGLVKAFDGTFTGGLDGHGLRAYLEGATGNLGGTGQLVIQGGLNVGGALTGTVTLSGTPIAFQPQAFLTIQVLGVTYKIPVFLP